VLKVLDFLIDNETFDHSKTDIAKGAGISRATLFNIWDILEKNGIVIATRAVGRAKMYKLDKANPIVKKFMELDDAISDFYAPQIKKEMLVKA
jgi:DNA-binding Lrp family transcriptional regulator